MKKKIKLYLHHTQFEAVTYNKRSGFFGLVFQLITFWLNTIVGICYAVGIILLSIAVLPWRIIKSLITIPQTVPAVFKRMRLHQFQKTVAVFSVLTILAGSTIHGLNLIAAGQDVKGQVLGASTSGFGYLQDAQTSLESENTAAAQISLSKALEQFKNSKETLNSTSIVLKGILAAVPQKRDADKLLLAAQHITEAGIKGTQLIELTSNLKLSAVGLSGDGNNKRTLLEIKSLLTQSVELANSAAELINNVSINSLPEKYQPLFVTAKDASALFQQNASTLK